MRFRSTLFLLPVAAAFAAESAMPTNHQDMAEALLDFLSRTELCLNSCVDADSVRAAIPELRKLATEADQLAAAQMALPEPTVQDFMAIQHRMGDFNNIWNAIQKHLRRLSEQGLMTDDFRQILKISL